MPSLAGLITTLHIVQTRHGQGNAYDTGIAI